MANFFGSGVSGILVAQRALATVGHNISNANTEGFSRQRADLVARPAQSAGNGFIGSGVSVTNVRRAFDGFLAHQVRSSTAGAAYAERFHELAAQVDNLFASPEAGLDNALQGFFSAMHDVADDPASLPARQVALSEAETLVQRFHTLDQRIDDLRAGVNQELRDLTTEVNNLAQEVASLNGEIIVAQGAAGGRPVNDLLDRRDEVLRQLATHVDLTTFEQENGAVNVTIGKGQALVVGGFATTLSVVSDPLDAGQAEIGITANGNTTIISDLLSGGKMAAVLDFRQQVLDEAQNGLGRVAIGLASTFNDQHRLGLDLNGALGTDFFNTVDSSSPTVTASSDNTGDATISVSVADVGALTTSDYRLDFDGTNYTLTRLSDDTVFALNTFPGGTETADGLSLSVTGGAMASGDSFAIRPTQGAAQDIALVVDSPTEIAAAAPVVSAASSANVGTASISDPVVNSPNNALRISFTGPANFDVVDTTSGATLATGVGYVDGDPITFNGLTVSISGTPSAGDVFTVEDTVSAVDPNNTGTGNISSATVAAPDPNLQDAVTITFGTPPNTFTVVGATTGSPTANVTYTEGKPISFNGWTVAITGSPNAGDSFTLGANVSGVGDNRNAALLADLQTLATLDNDSATYGEAYGQIVAEVGTATRRAEVNQSAQAILLDQVEQSRASVSGVNLDEEAADLLRFQQAYQASAQVVAAADKVFQTLLAAIGG